MQLADKAAWNRRQQGPWLREAVGAPLHAHLLLHSSPTCCSHKSSERLPLTQCPAGFVADSVLPAVYAACAACAVCAAGAVLHLDGMDAFDAATHCAALTAAERLTRQQQSIASSGQGAAQHPQHRSRSRSASRRQQQRASADVQLQVAAQHSAADSCPHSTAQHGSAAGRGSHRAGR